MKGFKNLYKISLLLFFVVLFSGCDKLENKVVESENNLGDSKQVENDVKLNKYKHEFFGTFDTVIDLIVFAENEDKANEYFDYIENRFIELDKEYSGFSDYEGINNVKKINDMAGIEPVKVSDELFNLVKDSIDWYHKYSPNTDMSFGAVTEIWKEYTELNKNLDPEDKTTKRLPDLEELRAANQSVNIENIELDESNKTIFIKDKNTVLDVGATGKGYAVEIVCDELEAMGCNSLIINAGGNVKTIGKPMDGREKWGVGVRNPDSVIDPTAETSVKNLFVNTTSVVTSGDYERYFTVDGENYHHIIDKNTLYPAKYFRGITIVYEDSGLADFLSTALFTMPLEEGKKLVESIDGAECLWINYDNSIVMTDGMKKFEK